MSAPGLPYFIVGGVILISFLSPAFVGSDGWIVPLVVLLFSIPYLLLDRRLARREAADGGAH